MKHKKRITVVILTMLLMANTLSMSASAAQRGNTPKEEVVYINLNADGSVKEINIVNIFDLNEKGTIIDYGEYENLRNMTTTDEIHYQNHVVTIDAGAGKLYYEGKLKKNSMPWDIGVKYYMDGREYSAEDIAGKSGRLKIKMAIKQNKNCNSVFFDGYALQATLTFDTDKVANIVADGATVANVGSDKQLVYTILPGKGAEMEITADVTDFEMDSINMNGIPLALNIEVDDAELMERITKLQDAVGELDDGMGKVYNGTSKLQNGVRSDIKNGVSELKDGAVSLQNGTAKLLDGGKDLQNGAANLQNGAASLHDGMKSMQNGITQTQNALNALNAQSGTLRDGSAAFISALENLKAAVSGNDQLSVVVTSLATEYQKIDGGITDYTNTVGKITSGYAQVSDGAAGLVNGSGSLVSGTQNLYKGTSDLLSGITEVYNGTGTLSDGTGKLDEGVEKLLTSIATLYNGAGELKNGTSTLRKETENMDTEIREQIDELLESITGSDTETVSFASADNINIDAVQFVIKTDAVKIAEQEMTATEPEETSGFWEKLFKLFVW